MDFIEIVCLPGVIVGFMIVESLLRVGVSFVVVAGLLGVVMGFLGVGPGILIDLNLLETVSLLEKLISLNFEINMKARASQARRVVCYTCSIAQQ